MEGSVMEGDRRSPKRRARGGERGPGGAETYFGGAAAAAERRRRRRRRERPKRHRIDLAFGDAADDGDAYEFDPDALLSSLCGGPRRRVPRPLPSAAAMAALSESRASEEARAAAASERRRSVIGGPAASRPSKGKGDAVMMPLLRRFVDQLEAEIEESGRGEGVGASGEVRPGADVPAKKVAARDGDDPSLVRARTDSDVSSPTSTLDVVKAPRDHGSGPAGNDAQGWDAAMASDVAATANPHGKAVLDPLDDPSYTTLTSGQRTRYAAYLSGARSLGVPPPTDATPRGREFRSLRDAVREERRLYCAALSMFRERNAERFLVGFKVPGPASKFVGAGSQLVAEYRSRLKKSSSEELCPAEVYGSCSQAISLHGMMSRIGENAIIPPDDKILPTARGVEASFNEALFAPRIVDTVVIGDCNTVFREEMLGYRKESTSLKPSTGFPICVPSLLCDDTAAKHLALKHGASVVLASETMEELLRRPGHESTRWTVPLLHTKLEFTEGDELNCLSGGVVIIEEPLPVQSTTREWMAKGFAESLKDEMCSIKPPTTSDTSDGPPQQEKRIQYVYTLLTLPPPSHSSHPGRRKAPLKLLVRTVNTIFDKSGRPVRLRVNLEYFPERGLELPSAHERAAWLLEKTIQPTCRVLFTRVDPNTARLLQTEEKGIAHSLASSDAGGKDASAAFDPGPHFEAMATVLRAAEKAGKHGRYVLCLPGRGVPPSSAATSVSVHRECKALESDPVMKDITDAISLECELSAADSVLTGQSFLMTCYRKWEWSSDRLPFTFPVKEVSAMMGKER